MYTFCYFSFFSFFLSFSPPIFVTTHSAVTTAGRPCVDPVNHTHRARTRDPISRALGSDIIYNTRRTIQRGFDDDRARRLLSKKKRERPCIWAVPGFVDTTVAVRAMLRVYMCICRISFHIVVSKTHCCVATSRPACSPTHSADTFTIFSILHPTRERVKERRAERWPRGHER